MPTGKLRAKKVKNFWYRILGYKSETGARKEKSLGRISEEEAEEMREHGPQEAEFIWIENGDVRLVEGVEGELSANSEFVEEEKLEGLQPMQQDQEAYEAVGTHAEEMAESASLNGPTAKDTHAALFAAYENAVLEAMMKLGQIRQFTGVDHKPAFRALADALLLQD